MHGAWCNNCILCKMTRWRKEWRNGQLLDLRCSSAAAGKKQRYKRGGQTRYRHHILVWGLNNQTSLSEQDEGFRRCCCLLGHRASTLVRRRCLPDGPAPEVSPIRKDISNVPKFGTFQTSFQSLGRFTHSEKTFQTSQTSQTLGRLKRLFL